MDGGMVALGLGTLLALGALAFVLYPVFAESVRPQPMPAPAPRREPSASERAVAALREIEFDRATGKLSDADYDKLHGEYTREAIAAMRAEEGSAADGESSGDAVEAIILRYRTAGGACPACGSRPEPDAIYCSSCGRHLAGSCARCAAPITELGARHCTQCGIPLAG